MATFSPYRRSIANLVGAAAAINWVGDDIRFTLHNSTYVPDLNNHDFVNDLTGELVSSGGYIMGGVALGSKSAPLTVANAWGTPWQPNMLYATGDIIRPQVANGSIYRVIVGGTSAVAEPVFSPIYGQCVTDGNGVPYENVGGAIVTCLAAASSWGPAAFFGPFRYGVVSDRQPVGAANQPLLMLLDFGMNITLTNDSLTVPWSPLGVFQVLVP